MRVSQVNKDFDFVFSLKYRLFLEFIWNHERNLKQNFPIKLVLISESNQLARGKSEILNEVSPVLKHWN